MLFPDSPRVFYKRNTLESVICQLRFPPILRIESDLPADFQDRIRDRFAFYRKAGEVELPAGVPPQLAKLIVSDVSDVNHEFVSEQQNWVLNLTKEFVALTARSYQTWEAFKECFEAPFAALREIYQVSFFTRIGLRYRNVIRRSALDLSDRPWRDLLMPHVLGELGQTDVSENVVERKSEVVFRLPLHDALLKVRYALGSGKDSEDETSFIIDADFFTTTRTDVSNATDTLNTFNREAGRFFRWCITQELHDAMEPAPPTGT